MKKVHDQTKLANYIKTYNLQDYMQADLLELAALHFFKKGEHLIYLDEASDYLYFLVEGTITVYSYSSDTQNVCINYAKPVALLGEASSLWDLPPKSSVKAVSDCVCVSISLKKHRKKLQNDVLFLQNICRLLSQRLNSGITVANSLTEPVKVRLAKFILQNSKEKRFDCQLTTCAEMLNVSYRHLLRTITEFRKAEIITKKENYYIINTPKALEEIIFKQHS